MTISKFNTKPAIHKNMQHGLTLIEILVAVVILSVGLLGLAGLQVMGLKNISISGTHAQAAILANELAERMHINDATPSDYEALDYAACATPGTTPLAKVDYCTVLASAIGDNDMSDGVDTSNENALLRRYGNSEIITIAPCGGSCGNPNMYTITMRWAEIDQGGNNAERTYTFNFRP